MNTEFDAVIFTVVIIAICLSIKYLLKKYLKGVNNNDDK